MSNVTYMRKLMDELASEMGEEPKKVLENGKAKLTESEEDQTQFEDNQS